MSSTAAVFRLAAGSVIALEWNLLVSSRVSLSKTSSLLGRNNIVFVLLSVTDANAYQADSIPRQVFSSRIPYCIYLYIIPLISDRLQGSTIKGRMSLQVPSCLIFRLMQTLSNLSSWYCNRAGAGTEFSGSKVR
jgi:hypothetical protein